MKEMMAGAGDDSGVSYNRVFVLGGKESTMDEFKEIFGKYGEVRDVWMVDDRKTGDFKGVTYITFSKASEAALAIEELNGRVIGSNPKPLKVLLANDKREGNVRDPKEGEKMMRLFIMVPRSDTEEEIREKFEEYGKVEYVRLIKDRKSGTSKGLAYVKYFRAHHACVALENCDSAYKAVFAAPKSEGGRGGHDKYEQEFNYDRPPPAMAPHSSYSSSSYDGRYNRSHDMGWGGGGGGGGGEFNNPAPKMPLIGATPGGPGPLESLLSNYTTENQTSLEVMAAPGVTADQLRFLLDMTPGLEFCELDRESGVAYAQYKFPQCAAYAKEKLTYLEYPPGYRIAVRFPQGQQTGSFSSAPNTGNVQEAAATLNSSLQGLQSGNMQGNLESLVDSIKKATDILQRVGVPGTSGGAPASTNFDEERVRFCNVMLPLTKPFATRESQVAQRLFIVSQPESFSNKYLQDIFCRFGELIDVYFMPGKNFGYAKFANMETAEQCIKVLHGQQVCGMRLKVMKADPPKYEEKGGSDDFGNKRPRIT